MTITALFTGIFAFFEAIPILRDGFYAALDTYYQNKINAAQAQRTDGFNQYANAKTPLEYQTALSAIIRGKSV